MTHIIVRGAPQGGGGGQPSVASPPPPPPPIVISPIYTRVLTRVQLTSSREPSSNRPMDVSWVNPGYNTGWVNPGLQSGLGGGNWSKLNPS